MPIYTRYNISKINRKKIEDLLERREVEEIKYYKNIIFSRDFMQNNYSAREHVWSHGDKLYKLAQRYFGDRDLFWIIGLFNNKPTDSHYSYGDIVYIPIDFRAFLNDVVK
tara:strand:- start:65 stop:394 length:330 start_codon:yes stop_codon:yes gene_type:complete